MIRAAKTTGRLVNGVKCTLFRGSYSHTYTNGHRRTRGPPTKRELYLDIKNTEVPLLILCVSLVSLTDRNPKHNTITLKQSLWTYQSEILNYLSPYKNHILVNSSSHSLIWNHCRNSDPLIAFFLQQTKSSPSEAYSSSIICQSFWNTETTVLTAALLHVLPPARQIRSTRSHGMWIRKTN